MPNKTWHSANIDNYTFFSDLYYSNKTKLKYDVFISWAKAPALYVTMSQEEVVEVVDHFLDLAFRAQIELRNVKVKVTLG